MTYVALHQGACGCASPFIKIQGVSIVGKKPGAHHSAAIRRSYPVWEERQTGASGRQKMENGEDSLTTTPTRSAYQEYTYLGLWRVQAQKTGLLGSKPARLRNGLRDNGLGGRTGEKTQKRNKDLATVAKGRTPSEQRDREIGTRGGMPNPAQYRKKA